MTNNGCEIVDGVAENISDTPNVDLEITPILNEGSSNTIDGDMLSMAPKMMRRSRAKHTGSRYLRENLSVADTEAEPELP
jgi:hypothetical protein